MEPLVDNSPQHNQTTYPIRSIRGLLLAVLIRAYKKLYDGTKQPSDQPDGPSSEEKWLKPARTELKELSLENKLLSESIKNLRTTLSRSSKHRLELTNQVDSLKSGMSKLKRESYEAGRLEQQVDRLKDQNAELLAEGNLSKLKLESDCLERNNEIRGLRHKVGVLKDSSSKLENNHRELSN
ncbi:hypothetical protein B0H67DRAFT_645643 [Lasiosphaeris hirsuta]|uniref:Uncharacterized protein n=1 Tax=Lasiosphaeris hirsuta TaxID=260670 RepID=A0AA40AHL9_9PEZI|nr:hypothetical protein B0H67DRAFT_645643 [Lasiosphaeris hirsuta]